MTNILDTKWSDLLSQAVNQPGLILKAYSAFWNYSLGNQLAAIVQCSMRGIEPGPIDTFIGWKEKNRFVRKGEKAIVLCMPICRKVKDEAGDDQQRISTFMWKPRWFVLSQTEAMPDAEQVEQAAPQVDWNRERALTALNVVEVPFTNTNGNIQGYAIKREIAINPLAAIPHKTLFHELAHIELGHTQEADFQDTEATPRNLREVEAEAVALLLCESLQLPGADYCRGYIQNWLQGDVIPEKSAQKIFGAADRILKAGSKQ